MFKWFFLFTLIFICGMVAGHNTDHTIAFMATAVCGVAFHIGAKWVMELRSYVTPVVLEPGKVYVVQLEQHVPMVVLKHLREELQRFAPESRFVVLPPDMRLEQHEDH